MLKKYSAFILILALLLVSAAAGCAKDKESNPANPQSTPQEQTPQEQSPQQNSETRQDSGKYVGQIDNNSIEITINGVPEKEAARAFRLDEIREEFDKLELNSDEEISITYRTNEHGQNILLEIKRKK